MENIIDQIKKRTELNQDYWDFKNNGQVDSYALSKLMKYPAMMVSEMQKELIGIISSCSNIESMVDPFCGSGTTLVESLKYDIQPSGIDINPLAYLLVSVKAHKYNIKSLQSIIFDLKEELKKDFVFPIHSFDGIDKWFRNDIKNSLSRIRYLISKNENLFIRKFLWVVFSDLVRDACNSRTSTYKLHLRNPEQISNLSGDVESLFIEKGYLAINEIERFYTINKSEKKIKFYYGDVLKLLKDRRRFKDGCTDLICTSPPYGDNSTTITYGEFSILPLRWIDCKDIDEKIDEKLLKTLCAIDNLSLGGKNYSIRFIEESDIFEKSTEFKSLYDFLMKEERQDKARKVASFIMDYDQYFRESVRVLRSGGFQVITLGNRTVHDKLVRFDKITCELAEFYGLEFIWSIKRNIKNKRRPKTVNKNHTQTINEETILILRK